MPVPVIFLGPPGVNVDHLSAYRIKSLQVTEIIASIARSSGISVSDKSVAP